MIDFSQPFVLGIFWAVIGSVLFTLLIVVVVLGWRRLAHYDHALEIQDRETLKNASEIAVLKERARLIDAQHETEQQLATHQLASTRREDINTRQRWTLTANQLLIAKSWIALLIAAARSAGIAIPLPPNIEELDRRPDESVFYDEIARSDEYRLDDLIAEVRAEQEPS